MARNQHRDSAGRILIGFSFLILIVVIVSLQDWWDRTYLEGIELPTAVEDEDYYTGLGEDDFGTPNLRFAGAPGEGLYRLSPAPLTLRDFRMRKLFNPDDQLFLRDDSRSLYVYRYDKDPVDEETGAPQRYFVKG